MDKYNDIQQQAIEERIDAFIRGAMTEAEEQAFKQEIKADPELRAQVLATVSMIKRIRSQEAARKRRLSATTPKKDYAPSLHGLALLQLSLPSSSAIRKTSGLMNSPHLYHPTIQSIAWMNIHVVILILPPSTTSIPYLII